MQAPLDAAALDAMLKEFSEPPVRYKGVIGALCTKLDLPFDEVMETNSLDWKGTAVGFMHQGMLNPGGMKLFFDLNELPKDKELERSLLKLLLSMNLANPIAGGAFGLIPDNDHVAFSVNFNFPDDDSEAADALIELIENMTQQLQMMPGLQQMMEGPIPEGAVMG